MKRRRTSRSARLRRRTRRKRVGAVFYRLLCVFLVIGAGILALTIFFKVNTIKVTGTTRYPVAQIQQTLDIKIGDNLFFASTTRDVQRLKREYPYICQVRVHRQLPDTLVVEITEGQAVAALDDGSGGAYLISGDGKLLEDVADATTITLPMLVGVSPATHKVGETLGTTQDATEKTLLAVIQQMNTAGLMSNVNFINVTDVYNIHVGYGNRLDVRLGSTVDLQRKVEFLIQIINDKLSPSDVGVVDLTNVSRMYFWPDTLENVQAASGKAASASTAIPQDDTTQTTGQAT